MWRVNDTSTGSQFVKFHLDVKRFEYLKIINSGHFVRCESMSCEDKPAIFDTFEQARHVADTHMREGYPNSERINDGFSWLPDPEIASFSAARAGQ